MPLNPGNWWFYFDRSDKSIAACKADKCAYSKDLGAAMSTNCLAMHIKNHHPDLYKQREDYLEKKKPKHTKQDNPLKRAFKKTSAVLDENGNEKANESGQGPILQALNVVKKSVWDVGGSSALAANKSLMEMLSTAILPFSFVDNPGFERFCQCLQPRFKLPGRMHFSRYELPEMYDKLKSRIMQDLRLIDFLSFTTDGWTASDGKHSLISLTRTEEFQQWLIHEAENGQTSQKEIDTVLMELDANSTGSADDMFASFEKNKKNEMVFQIPAPSQNVLESRQRAELEVVDYLRDPKIKRTFDPGAYWKVNEQKWPLLARLVREFHCAPATSSESERLFSTAGLIVTDLRKKLLPENRETSILPSQYPPLQF